MTARRMTVLQVLPALGIGGAERATLDIAAALVRAGHRALVMSEGGPMVPQLLESGAEHVPFEAGSKNPLTIWKNRKRLIDFIAAQKVSLLHVRSRAPAWSSYYAARSSGIPFVTTFHDAYRGSSAGKKFYNGIMASGDRVIAISSFVAQHIRDNYPQSAERIALIPRGIDFSVFDRGAVSAQRKLEFLAKAKSKAKQEESLPLLVLPARFSHTKGHEIALRAIAKLREHPLRCLMIGPSRGRAGYFERLKGLRDALELEEKVSFLEEADLVAAYACADIVLSPSQKAEGFGRVPVEAQAMGVPVIATALGATSETVLDNVTGWLVPAGDVEALANAIRRGLAVGPEQRSSMAEKGIAHVRANFDVRKMCAATLELYEGLLKAGGHSRSGYNSNPI